MRVPYRWLKDYVDTESEPETLAEKLTMAGIPVEHIDYFGGQLDRIVVGRVIEKTVHPTKNHLHICTVDTGESRETIVCGADNIETNKNIALALPGAVLPDGREIGISEIHGVDSAGMICSAEELGFIGLDKEGIWILPDDLALGSILSDVLPLRDCVFELELTPNRSDCLGVINVAREAVAVTDGHINVPQISYPEYGPEISSMVEVDIADKERCPRYVMRLVQGVKVASSPLWLQLYILKAGMRPVNNVVDIANYVMLEMNQPLHTFDYRFVHGGKIVVRKALQGEKITTLDEKERDLSDEDLLICDAKYPICIAGIMGGIESVVTEDTTDILIESACFSSASVRGSLKRHNINSEAAIRFSKGVDYEQADMAAKRAVQLLVDIAGGVACRGSIDIISVKQKEKRIALDIKRVNALLGTNLSLEQIADIMRKLSFIIERTGNQLLVSIPNYRQDIVIEEDLIEEVARLYGLENILSAQPVVEQTYGIRSAVQLFERRLKNICTELGLMEVVNYALIDLKEYDRLMYPKEHPWRASMTVLNPLSASQAVMRTTILSGLLNTASRNFSRRNTSLALYESGTVFLQRKKTDNLENGLIAELPEEVKRLGILLTGSEQDSWQAKGRGFDFYYIKGIIDRICKIAGVEYETSLIKSENYLFLHPFKSSEILIDGENCGYFGVLHPEAKKNYHLDKLQGEVLVAEISLDYLFERYNPIVRVPDISKYPSVSRDMAVAGRIDIPLAAVERVIRRCGVPYLKDCQLFDVYSGVNIEQGCRSLAFSLLFQSGDKTLLDTEVDRAFMAITSALEAELGYKLRLV